MNLNSGVASMKSRCYGTSKPLEVTKTLILSRPYVAGIFWVACAHLVPRVLLDYQGTSLINAPHLPFFDL